MSLGSMLKTRDDNEFFDANYNYMDDFSINRNDELDYEIDRILYAYPKENQRIL